MQDEDGSNGQSNGLSDLQNLSQLTELARLKDVDSDFGDDEDEDELNNLNLHSNGNKLAINGESHKRTLKLTMNMNKPPRSLRQQPCFRSQRQGTRRGAKGHTNS